MPMKSSNYEQGDVVVANLLFAEQAGRKIRPAIVISKTGYNQQSEDIILLKISTKGYETEYDIGLTNKDLNGGKLQQDSKIMVDNPVTIFKDEIGMNFAKISESKLKEIKEKMKVLYNM